MDRWMSSRCRHGWITEGGGGRIQKSVQDREVSELMVWNTRWGEWIGD